MGFGGRDYRDFPSEVFLSQSVQNFRSGTILCCVLELLG